MGAGLTPYDDVLGLDHLLLANGFEALTTLGGGANPNIVRAGNFTNYSAAGAVAVSNPSGNACLASPSRNETIKTNFRAKAQSRKEDQII